MSGDCHCAAYRTMTGQPLPCAAKMWFCSWSGDIVECSWSYLRQRRACQPPKTAEVKMLLLLLLAQLIPDEVSLRRDGIGNDGVL